MLTIKYLFDILHTYNKLLFIPKRKRLGSQGIK